jgi:hypothetical protein
MKAVPVLLALTVLVGCGNRSRDLSVLGPVTYIAVSGTDASHPLTKITDRQLISKIVAFADVRRTSWGIPWFGVPVSEVDAEFYDGTRFKGSFGAGADFFTTQRDGAFFSQSASPGDIKEFLNLLALNSDSPIARDFLDDDFHIVRSIGQLPAEVKSAFADLTKQTSFAMAEPGNDFQAGDVVMDGLPSRRLIFAGNSPHNWFLHYEKGGRGLAFYLIVFSINSGEVRFVWGGSLPEPTPSLMQLRLRVYAGSTLPSSYAGF